MPAPTPRIPTTASKGQMSYAIFQLARARRARAAAMLREMDLHPGQELLLMQLLDRDGQTQSELLESVGLDHSTVSKSLRRMQDAGLLIREPAACARQPATWPTRCCWQSSSCSPCGCNHCGR